MEEENNQEIAADMAASVRAVENLLNYRFHNKRLLEEALTHSSCTDQPTSYQRLEFLGDAALGLAVAKYVYDEYPGVDQGKLTYLRSFNTSNEKLARVAVRHQLYKYVRTHNVTALDKKVSEFVMAVQEEDEIEIHGGLVKAPKILADIVESVAAAVYVDCNFDLKTMWTIIRDILEPIVTLDALEKQPQPVKKIFQLCQKDGKRVDLDYCREEENIVATFYVDGNFVASASSDQKENAKLQAAKAALEKLPYGSSDPMNVDMFDQLNEDGEIEEAKQKLHELCDKKKWSKPNYKIQSESGPAHQKKYICSAEIEIAEHVLLAMGNEKPRVSQAENSAASVMLNGLKDSNYI